MLYVAALVAGCLMLAAAQAPVPADTLERKQEMAAADEASIKALEQGHKFAAAADYLKLALVLGLGILIGRMSAISHRELTEVKATLTQNVNYSGALLHYQQTISPRNRVPLLIIPDNVPTGASAFAAWVRKHKPDVILSFDTYVPEWLAQLGRRIPDDIGLVVHDWTESMVGFAGVHHRRAHVAAAAVDLVATQLMHNEQGIPEVPRQILIPPAWIEGPSIRPPPPT